jgi:hypothetical protein
MRRSEVYSWRLAPALKEALEEVAQGEGKSVARLLEELAQERLRSAGRGPEDGAREQERLQASARRYVGAIAGGDPRRAEQARLRVRGRLARRRETRASHP